MPIHNYICNHCNASVGFVEDNDIPRETRGRCKKCKIGELESKPPKPSAGVYICDKCWHEDDYHVTTAHDVGRLPDDLKCPKCGEGNLVRDFLKSCENVSFDIVGYCYQNEYGKKAFHRLPPGEYAKILTGERNPY